MIQKRNSIVAISMYVFFFVFLSHIIYLTISTTDDSAFSKWAGFVVFQILSFYILSLLARVDGYWFSTTDISLFLSAKGILKRFNKALVFFGWFIGTGLLSVYFENRYAYGLQIILLLVTSIVYSITFYFWEAANYFRIYIDRVAFGILSLIIVMDIKFSLLEKQIVVLLLILGLLLFSVWSLWRDLRKGTGKEHKKGSEIINFFKSLFLSEFLAADHSKKNAENLVLIQTLTNENPDLKKFVQYLFTHMDSAFLKTDEQKNFKDQSIFLNLKRSEDFNVFTSNVQKKLSNEEHRKSLEVLKEVYRKSQKSHTEVIMNARTENIQLRNQNNLLIGILIFIIASIDLCLNSKGILNDYILYILMWMIFLRMVLRTTEIGKAFYSDIIESGYKNSYLKSTDRIRLVVRSVIEISFLAASIYQLNVVFLATDPVLKYCLNVSYTWWKTIEYSISVALFNVSFPEALLPQSNRNFIWLSTHLIQVMSSVLLITIVINSYMGRGKKLIYLEGVLTESNMFILFKKSKDSYMRKKKILEVDLTKIKSKSDFDKKIADELHQQLHNDSISEDDFLHAIKWLETNDYFLPF